MVERAFECPGFDASQKALAGDVPTTSHMALRSLVLRCAPAHKEMAMKEALIEALLTKNVVDACICCGVDW